MILLVIVGYEKIIANPALCALLAVFHLISNMSLWNNLRTKQNRGRRKKSFTSNSKCMKSGQVPCCYMYLCTFYSIQKVITNLHNHSLIKINYVFAKPDVDVTHLNK